MISETRKKLKEGKVGKHVMIYDVVPLKKNDC